MESWKRTILAGSAGLSVVLFLKGNRGAAFFFAGVGLATLASEYPEKFAEVRAKMPSYIERGLTLMEVASLVGERIADLTDNRRRAWYEALLSG